MKEILKTNDLGLITAIICLGIEPDDITNDNGVVSYLFVGSGLVSIRDKYCTGELQVSALNFNNQLRSVKTTIFGILGK